MARSRPNRAQSGMAQPAHYSLLPCCSPVSPKTRESYADGQGHRRPLFGVPRSPMIGSELAATAAKLPLSLSPSFLSLSLLHSSTACYYASGMAGHHGWSDLHRTHTLRRWRAPVAAQARRGSEHATGPEPTVGAGSTPAQKKGLRPSPPSLSPLVPHRTIPPMPVGPPTKAQARRGDRHIVETEPRSRQAAMATARSWALYDSLSLSSPSLALTLLEGGEAKRRPARFGGR